MGCFAKWGRFDGVRILVGYVLMVYVFDGVHF